MSNILLYAEVTKENYIHTVLFELAYKAQELSKKLNGADVSALLICKTGLAESFKEAFINSGFDYVYVAEITTSGIDIWSCSFFTDHFCGGFSSHVVMSDISIDFGISPSTRPPVIIIIFFHREFSTKFLQFPLYSV